MNKDFETIISEILKNIKTIDFSMKTYQMELADKNTTKIKAKKLNTWIDYDFTQKIALELILRKFYTWDEIRELENR